MKVEKEINHRLDILHLLEMFAALQASSCQIVGWWHTDSNYGNTEILKRNFMADM